MLHKVDAVEEVIELRKATLVGRSDIGWEGGSGR